ncbi:MAG TPA: tRNA (adenosine(37)-N6)-threonylcarbamoyltransferase complex dimerization subunit type 1 TsaB [Blastocatellia bacterium]|nr:tRNA (adenosine(37)-N6)-threonylcarbamoyltransferase complex dimerization subunit type 1 TsaB [Blastocatellia bacterium]
MVSQSEKLEDPLILSLDTSSRRTSLALARGGLTLSIFGALHDESRSERLWYELEFLLKESGVSIGEIDLFAVCTGPGSFTGLRVGIAAIKGLATASGKPVAGVTSLEALANAARDARAVIALVNAYKGELYAQRFEREADGFPRPQTGARIAKHEEIAADIAGVGSLTLIGEGAGEVLKTAREVAGDDRAVDWAVEDPPQFLADRISSVAYLKYGRGEAVRAGELEAAYVRPADAELKLSLGLVGKGLGRE